MDGIEEKKRFLRDAIGMIRTNGSLPFDTDKFVDEIEEQARREEREKAILVLRGLQTDSLDPSERYDSKGNDKWGDEYTKDNTRRTKAYNAAISRCIREIKHLT